MPQPPLPPGEWTPLPVHASARTYARGSWRGRPALLADFGADGDGRERFAVLAGWLRRGGIRVPEVLEAPAGERWLVQEFVEGASLSTLRWDDALEDEAVRLALSFSELRRESWPPELLLHALDGPRLRFELSFFDLHFLQGLLNWAPDEARSAALGRLAEEVSGYPTALVHRDFHSDNLLRTPAGELVVLDFQDLLVGPRCYDLASLQVDAYRVVPVSLRERCAEAARGLGAVDPELAHTSLQRGLKALGTFGYQVTRLKRPRYLSAAKETLPKVLRLLRGGALESHLPAEALKEAAAWM